MSQYQPPQQPQGAPGPQPNAQPSPFGQQPQGYGQQPQPPFGQASFGQQSGYPQQGHQPPQQRAAEPGLLDTTFATPITPKIAKTAYVAVIVLAVALTLMGLLTSISSFSDAAALAGYSGAARGVLIGIAQLVLYPALGFAVLTLGRMVIEYLVESHKARERGAPSD